MGVQTGNSGVISIDGTAVAQLRGWTLSRRANRVDATVMGDTERSSLAGFQEGQGTIAVAWDETDANGQEAIMAALAAATAVALVLYPKGNAPNLPRITIASAVLLGVEDAGALDELLERTFEFGKSSGSIVEDTVP